MSTSPPHVGDGSLLVYFGHHKAASTWVNRHVRAICRKFGLRQRSVPSAEAVEGGVGALVRREGIGFLSMTNADVHYLSDLPRFRGFHVVRDPRDVVVSAFYSHRDTHELRQDWMREHRAALRTMTVQDGLLREIERSGWNMTHLREWDYGRPDVLELKMEDLTADASNGWLEITRFLGLLQSDASTVSGRVQRFGRRLRATTHRRTGGRIAPPRRYLSEDTVRGIVDKYAFQRITKGRAPGEEDATSHFRKGVPGDWRNHFGSEHRELFDELWGDILLKLGYERDRSWVDPELRTGASDPELRTGASDEGEL